MATAKNTITTLSSKIQKATNIKPALVEELAQLSEETGKSMAWFLNRALANFLNDEAPIWATKAQSTAPARRMQAKPFIVSRAAMPSTPLTDDVLEAILQDWAGIRDREESEPAGAFSRSEVDKSIAYLDEDLHL